MLWLVLVSLDLVNSFLCDGVGLHCVSDVKPLVVECRRRHQGLLMLLELFSNEMLPAVAGLALESRD